MHVRTTLRPGDRGTRALVSEFGERLVCVRYRYDPENRKRYKTAELIVDERPWTPSGKDAVSRRSRTSAEAPETP